MSTLKRRALIGLAFAACASGIAAGLGVLPDFYDTETEPSQPPPALPEVPKLKPDGHIAIDETAERRKHEKKARDAFAFAKKHNFLEPFAQVCAVTDFPLPCLLSIACFETDLGKNTGRPRTVANSPPQTASGIVQITDKVFTYLVAKHSAVLQQQIGKGESPDVQAMMEALPFVTYDPKSGNVSLRNEEYIQHMKKKALDHASAHTPHPTKGHKAKLIPVRQIPVPDLREQILRGRNNHSVSLLLVASDLKCVENSIVAGDGTISSELKFWMAHRFGLTRANNIIRAHQSAPDKKMCAVFKVEDPADPKFSVYGNNGINPNMRVDDFVRLSAIRYDAVRSTLTSNYAAYAPADAPDQVASRPPSTSPPAARPFSKS